MSNYKENKEKYLLKLRKCMTLETVYKIISKKEDELKGEELIAFYAASDHRLAEITMKRLYDRVPAEVWTFVQ